MPFCLFSILDSRLQNRNRSFTLFFFFRSLQVSSFDLAYQPSMTSNWTEDILKELNLRDEKEKQNSSYFIAFSQLSQKLTNKGTGHRPTISSSSTDSSVPPSSGSSSSDSPSPSLTAPVSKQNQSTTAIIDEFTLKENQTLKMENNELIQSLNQSTITNEKLESIIQQQSNIIKSLESKNTKLKNKIDGMVLEIKEKNKTIELINDEILTNQIQFNVMRDKLEKLEKQ